FGRRAQAAANALRLRLLLGRGLPLGLGIGVELAADELDLGDLGAVTAPVAQAQDAGVTARPRLEPRCNRVEQLADDVAVLDVAEDEPARVKRGAVTVSLREPALGNRDDPLDEGAQLLRLRDRRLDVLELDQALGLIAEHRDAMLRDAAQFSVCYSMAHGYS